jgi:hypothetical protein
MRDAARAWPPYMRLHLEMLLPGKHFARLAFERAGRLIAQSAFCSMALAGACNLEVARCITIQDNKAGVGHRAGMRHRYRPLPETYNRHRERAYANQPEHLVPVRPSMKEFPG